MFVFAFVRLCCFVIVSIVVFLCLLIGCFVLFCYDTFGVFVCLFCFLFVPNWFVSVVLGLLILGVV